MRSFFKKNREKLKRRLINHLLDAGEGLFLLVFRRRRPGSPRRPQHHRNKFGGGGASMKL